MKHEKELAHVLDEEFYFACDECCLNHTLCECARAYE